MRIKEKKDDNNDADKDKDKDAKTIKAKTKNINIIINNIKIISVHGNVCNLCAKHASKPCWLF